MFIIAKFPKIQFLIYKYYYCITRIEILNNKVVYVGLE